MAASGIDSRSVDEVRTLADYTQPLLELMAAIPPAEKVVVVGHSLGGLNISLAMEMFPHKIAVAVFLAAFLPDYTHSTTFLINQFLKRGPEELLDTEFLPVDSPQEILTSMSFGPNFIASKLYQLSSPEDVALANMLLRPSSLFRGDLSKKSEFTKERCGSVKRVYAMSTNDNIISENVQRLQIETNDVDEVKVIANADHMPMFSKPHDLCQCLLEVANTYA